MKCTCIGDKRCNCSCFEIDQEMDAILLIIGIVFGVCRIVIKSVQQCTYFLFSVNLLLVGVNCEEIINRWQFSFSKGEKWYDKLFNVKYLPLFHHFKAIYQFLKHIICFVKIVVNAPLNNVKQPESIPCNSSFSLKQVFARLRRYC